MRQHLVNNHYLRLLEDIDRGGFEEILDELVATVMTVFCKSYPEQNSSSIAIQPTSLDDNSRDSQRTQRKRAAVLVQAKKFSFQTQGFDVIKEKPIIYWWNQDFLKKYAETPKVEDETDVKQGLATGDNPRFLRSPWEVKWDNVEIKTASDCIDHFDSFKWVPYIKGAAGKAWFEPLDYLIWWKDSALEKQVIYEYYGSKGGGNGTPSRRLYFQIGVAFSMIGRSFTGRVHRYRSVFGNKGSSVFPKDVGNSVCLLNSSQARYVLSSLNPGK